MLKTPLVSVVIIGRNEGQRLVDCLASVASANTVMNGQLEVIYVDSASQDGSPQRAADLGAKVIEVKPLRPCASVGRNAGWRVATAPYVLFLDGDMLLDAQFLPVALEKMHDASIGVLFGTKYERYPERSVYNRVMELDWALPLGDNDFCGGDALMRREVLIQTGGYSEELIAGEEPELCQRIRALGYRIVKIIENMTVHDLSITSWAMYWKRAVRTGYAYAEVAQRMKNTDFPLWSRDTKRNLIHSAGLLAMLISAVTACVLLADALPLGLLVAAYGALSGRSAFRARHKSRNLYTLALFGVFSHLQQIPISLGQLRYWFNHYTHKQAQLIEYKQ